MVVKVERFATKKFYFSEHVTTYLYCYFAKKTTMMYIILKNLLIENMF